VIALPRELTAGDAIERLRQLKPAPELAYYVYVVAAEQRLEGVISLRDLVVADPATPLAQVMDPHVLSVNAETEKQDVAALIAKYDLLALPVLDARRRLIGTVTIDDVVELMLPRGWKKRSLRSIAR
ncbi:MAG: CBS domain-containing protein, partial [Chloroflexota bacterium]